MSVAFYWQVTDIYVPSHSILGDVAKRVPTMDLVDELTNFEKETQLKDMKVCWVNGKHNHFVLV